MNPDNTQFPTCGSCGRGISGEANTVKNDKSLFGLLSFHKNPEDCAKVPAVKMPKVGSVDERKRARKQTDWTYE